MQEDWLNAKWRPAMGWVYMITCTTDFMKQAPTPWQPLTLQGAGIYHISMGAIVGVAAFGRTKEKLSGVHYAPVVKTGKVVPIQEDEAL